MRETRGWKASLIRRRGWPETFAKNLHELTKKSRYDVQQMDAMDTPRLTQFIKENKIDVTLNACPWVVNHSVLEACAAGGSLLRF